MKNEIFGTNINSFSPLFMRITLGGVLFAHGAQKLLGCSGGFGFQGTMDFLTGTVGLPWIVGFFVIVIEFFGSVSLILGFGVRIWSIAMFFMTLGIIQTSHMQYGFFMNWLANQKGEGIEYFLLMLGLAASIAISGAGKFSIDEWILEKKSLEPKNRPSLREEDAVLG